MATQKKADAKMKTVTMTAPELKELSLLDKKALLAEMRKEITAEQEATKEVRKSFRSAKKGFRNEYKYFRDLMVEFKRLSEKSGCTEEDMNRMGELRSDLQARSEVLHERICDLHASKFELVQAGADDEGNSGNDE